jgi:hypothetical protein
MKIYSIDLEFFKNDPTYYFEKERFGKSFFYNVSYKGYEAKVYVFELYKILSNESFPLFKKNETLNGLSLIPIYIEGFKKGKEFFKSNYKVSTEILFPNMNEYVKTLQTCYCHKEQGQGKRGWCWYRWNYPIIFNDEKIKEYGYFAGIISEIDELKEHYHQFKVIGQCEHNLPPQQIETKTDKLKAPALALFCNLINKIGIDKKDETESATVYCKRICVKFKLPYTDRVRQNYNVKETKNLIQELTKKVLPLIDNETKISVEKYLDSKQPPKQNLYA